MEKKNNSGMLAGILIGIIIMLLVVGGLFVTGIIGFKTNTTTDNGQTSENNQGNNTISETQNSNIQEKTKKNFDSFIGTWENEKTLNNIEIKKITDNEITFTWFLYRLTGIDDDTTISFDNGRGIFYFKGYEDKNFDSKETEDEKYIRKATIVLTDNGVDVIVEDVSSIDNNYKVVDNFDSVWVKAGTYSHPTKVS